MGRALVPFGLLLSGAAGLAYQVCWIRAASLVLGSTTLAVSTVVAVFFLGLAVGSEAFGRVALAARRPLRLLVGLEIGIAALAGLVLPGLEAADPIFGAAYRRLGGSGALLDAARLGIVALLLLPPTVLMGGTLPLACRALLGARSAVVSGVGWLYAVNTLGAFVGCLLTGLVLLPRVGLGLALAAGVLASLAAAAAFAAAQPRSPSEPAPAPSSRTAAPPRLAALFFATGLVALGAEVLWARFLVFVVRQSAETYTLALSVVLLGILMGSAAIARWPVRRERRAAVFGALQVGHGLSLFVLLHLPPEAWLALGGRLAPLGLLLLPPALLSGASFPLAVGLAVADPRLAAGGVGRLLAANTLGGIALLVGFALLPALGMDATLSLLCGVSIGVGISAWRWLGDASLGARARPLAAVALVLFAALHGVGGARLPEDWLARGGEVLLAHREGRTATLAVVESGGDVSLKMDGWWQGGREWSHQAVAAHVPMLLHPEARRVLVVGVGAGQTPARFLLYRTVERVDCVDVEPAVFEVIRDAFDAAWLGDPRVRAIHADGRAHLLHGAERYDVISLELGQAFRPGVADFYTLDFYHRTRERLRPGGLLVQFVPLPFLEPAVFRSLVASFVQAFPRSLLWYNTSELLLVGAAGDTDLGSRLIERLAAPAVRSDLAHRHWGPPGNELHDPIVFLGGFLSGPSGVAALAADAEPLRDGLLLDRAAGRVPEHATLEIGLLPLLRAQLDPVDATLATPLTPVEREAIARVRRGNLGEIEANAWVRSVSFLDPETEAAEIETRLARAHAANPEHAPTRLRLGDAALRAGRPEAAIAHLQAAVRLDESDAEARRALGVALLAAGRYGEAAHQLRRAQALGRSDAEVWNALGIALAGQGHAAPALRAFEEALRLDPQHADAQRNLARAQGFSGPARSPGFPSESP